MGIKSTIDWSDVIVNGVVLGQPAPLNPVYDADGVLLSSEGFHWDGGIPNGDIDVDGDFLGDGDEDAVRVKFVTMEGVDLKLKEPKDTKLVKVETDEPVVDENGDPVLDKDGVPVTKKVTTYEEVPNLYVKGQTVFFEGELYVCNKDDILFDAASKDWVVPKTKEVK